MAPSESPGWQHASDDEDIDDRGFLLDERHGSNSNAIGSYSRFFLDTSRVVVNRLVEIMSNPRRRLVARTNPSDGLRFLESSVADVIASSALFQLSMLILDPHTYHYGYPHRFNPPWAWPSVVYEEGAEVIPRTFPGSVQPLDCHSHNDNERRLPLFEALHYGCTSIEADVWLLEQDESLLVGHSRHSLHQRRNLASMYIRPIEHMLDQRNPAGSTPVSGVFDLEPQRSLVLLVDLKSDGYKALPILEQQLAPLRSKGYLTHYNGRWVVDGLVTVVVTGNAPFDLVTADDSYRDVFFDAPLALIWEDHNKDNVAEPKEIHATPLEQEQSKGQGLTGLEGITNASVFTPINSYYASVSYKQALNRNFPPIFPPSASQVEMMRQMVEAAQSQGLKVRFWSAPNWPPRLRNTFWAIATLLGVDMIGVDDARAYQLGHWRQEKFTAEELGEKSGKDSRVQDHSGETGT
ncbi:hypothetical protein FH972_022803 [Carpinus fangiana]|uniref:Altered inheritance of mitochondria protein 6 n=1 Tax=Carpinus fangiana TaxID=176857 RepID=A0A5N6KVI8_9ROSI|nr:hypothetical protein FH972_022803 [Carpinus fangiana]